MIIACIMSSLSSRSKSKSKSSMSLRKTRESVAFHDNTDFHEPLAASENADLAAVKPIELPRTDASLPPASPRSTWISGDGNNASAESLPFVKVSSPAPLIQSPNTSPRTSPRPVRPQLRLDDNILQKVVQRTATATSNNGQMSTPSPTARNIRQGSGRHVCAAGGRGSLLGDNGPQSPAKSSHILEMGSC